MVKSILQVMSTYLFSILAVPKAILKQIRSIQRNFLWGSSGEKAKFSLVSWEDVCKPKEHGGLGLRDPEIMSEILGAKIWWRWVSHSTEPWAKLWNVKYARGRPRHALIHFNETPNGSPIWLKALAGRSIVQEHSFWEIRNGNRVKFWDDAWNQFPILGRNSRWTHINHQEQERG